MCAGQNTQNVGNIRTVEVLVFNPNGPYIYVQNVRGSVTQQSQRQVDSEIRPAGSDKRSQPQQYSASGCVTHARRMGRCVVTLCSVDVACCLPGIRLGCVLMR